MENHHCTKAGKACGEQAWDKWARERWDAIIVGAGVSGPRIGLRLAEQGMKVLLLEAGKHFNRNTYPTREVDANSQLYWGGGIELNTKADIGILRPKVVGGGSIVNQALIDRFDDDALDSWKETSGGVSFFNKTAMAPWYDLCEAAVAHQKIPVEFQNGNAKIFREGLEKNGYKWDVLTRAQKDCRYSEGNDCIECLAGCRIDSKQSSAITMIPKAQKLGMVLGSEFEVDYVKADKSQVEIFGRDKYGTHRSFMAGRLVLASGAIGNSKILLNSGFSKSLPALGKNFYTHPQSMCLGIYDEPIHAHKGPLQTYKSADPGFRKQGFKLENVFVPPVAISMLLPGFGLKHMRQMQKITHMACVEVAVRDTHPGEIRMLRPGSFQIVKEMNAEDKAREARGKKAIRQVFESTGAREIIEGSFAIGLHLMGGLGLGAEDSHSVVDPEFKVHGHANIHVADSSIFPNAPGINPSLTIMALSEMAAASMLKSLGVRTHKGVVA